MIRSMKSMTLLGSLVFLVLMVACASSGSKETSILRFSLDSAAVEGPFGSPGNPGMPSAPAAPAPAAPAFAVPAPAAPAPAAPAPAAPAPAAASRPGPTGESGAAFDEDLSTALFIKDSAEGPGTEEQAALVSQQRIIVRTVDMRLVVDDVAGSVDDIAALARNAGGWVVSSDRSAKHRGATSVRVPADKLDAFVLSLRNLAVEVDSESSTSKDVTDEYVDNKSRLTSLQATEQALIGLLDRAETVEEALEVQRELSKLQAEIESRQGRIKFLEETAAFSLVNVGLRLAPQDMAVEAGENQTYSVGQFARFRATFVPPEDIEEFTFTWDFGDGSPQVSGHGSAPSVEEGRRFTATVNHTYFDDKDSPYIVEIEITGTGDGGVAEGSDTFIATVTRVPTIEVFAGGNGRAEAGEEIKFEGSFTRPEGLRDIQYKWEFGDQTAPLIVTPEDGVTRATATHVYADHRPFPYNVTLTVTAQSDAGEIETVSQLSVFVAESKGLVISGWSAKDTTRTAIRTMSGVAQVAGTVIIFAVFLSPVWIVIGLVLFFGRRRLSAKRKARAEARQLEERAEPTGSDQ